MDRTELVAKLAEQTGTSVEAAGLVLNATIAELVAPRIFGPPEGLVGFLDNHCTNNCKEEVARIAAGLPVAKR